MHWHDGDHFDEKDEMGLVCIYQYSLVRNAQVKHIISLGTELADGPNLLGFPIQGGILSLKKKHGILSDVFGVRTDDSFCRNPTAGYSHSLWYMIYERGEVEFIQLY